MVSEMDTTRQTKWTGTSRRLAWERTKRQRAQDTESDVELHQKKEGESIGEPLEW